MDDVQIIHGDCREVMAGMEAGSVDAIVTDPPFFRCVNAPWDRAWKTEVEYLEWLGTVADEWRRVLKPNGSLYCFASPRMAAKVELLIGERFRVVNAIVWRKDSPSHALMYGTDHFRGFVEMSERIVFAEQLDGDAIASESSGYCGAADAVRRRVFGAYIEGEIARSGVTKKSVAELFPSRTGGTTGCVSNWLLGLNTPTAEQYGAIKEFLEKRGGVYLAREYTDLAREYEAQRRPFNVKADQPFTDVWDFPVPKRATRHPCEKPIRLLGHILNVSTRPGDLVLDSFAGSGSTLVACLKSGRRGIGIELEPKYIPTIERRVSEARTPLFTS